MRGDDKAGQLASFYQNKVVTYKWWKRVLNQYLEIKN